VIFCNFLYETPLAQIKELNMDYEKEKKLIKGRYDLPIASTIVVGYESE
jgi:hypothetical protein